MKRTRKEESLLKLRKAAQRIQEINHILSKLPTKPLPKKMFAGHWRFLKVREDVLRSSVGQQAANVVELCNNWVLGKKKDPNSYRTSTEVCYPINGSMLKGGSTWREGQGLKPISEDQFEASGLPEFYKRKWFIAQEVVHRLGSKVIIKHRYFPNVPKHMLEFGYKAAYVTEVGQVCGPLESELKKLYDFMDQHNGWTRIGQRRNRDEWDLSLEKKRAKAKLANAEVREALQFHEPE